MLRIVNANPLSMDASVSVLWPQMASLAVYGVVVLGLSALRFHKKLD
jgi:ABC-2 type transport system permease protein